jgi:hypothetical protein
MLADHVHRADLAGHHALAETRVLTLRGLDLQHDAAGRAGHGERRDVPDPGRPVRQRHLLQLVQGRHAVQVHDVGLDQRPVRRLVHGQLPAQPGEVVQERRQVGRQPDGCEDDAVTGPRVPPGVPVDLLQSGRVEA